MKIFQKGLPLSFCRAQSNKRGTSMKKWLFLFSLLISLIGAKTHAETILQTSYMLESEQCTEYTAHIALTNTSDRVIETWRVDFDLPEGQILDSLQNGKYETTDSSWNSGHVINHQHITVTNEDRNGFLAPHESIEIAFKVNNPHCNQARLTNFEGVGNPDASFVSRAASQFPLNSKYNVDSNWTSGYQVTVTLSNNTGFPSSSWSASFTLQSGQSISSFWNGVYTANGQQITVSNPAWSGGGVIPANASTTFGMIINYNPPGSPGISNLQALANGNISPTPPPPPPPAPTAPALNAITVSPSTPSNYTVSWNSVANAASYLLQQDTTSSFSHPVVVAQGAMLSQSFTNQPNGTYYYRVSASNSTGTSPYSNVQSVVINVVPLQLSTPVLQPISNPSGLNQYQISWGAVANALGYKLQESTSSSFANAQTIFNGPGTSFQVTGKAPGTYYYNVTALAGSSTSSPSNVVSVIVTQQLPQASFFVEGYWESWDSTTSVSTIANMEANVIDISFANFTTTGTHTYAIAGINASQATVTQLIAAAHSLGKKVKISVGGESYPLGPQLQTTQDAVGMAQAIATYVQQNGLDGVDFDIEDAPAVSLQVALIQNTRQLLGNNALISYTPGSPASTTQPFASVIQGAYPYLTDISIMAYDYGSSYSYQNDVSNLISMGVPASKIVLGFMPGRDDLNVLTSLANITTAANYIKANGLGGIMFWDLNRDHENLTGLGADAATNTAWSILGN